jgi:Tfp pilus assembly protein FimT
MTSTALVLIKRKGQTMISPTGDSKHGFTLVELLFVSLTIIALTGMAVPRLNRAFPNLALKDAGKNLVSLIEYTQNRAIMEKRCYRLNLDSEKKNYWLTVQKEPEEYKEVKTSLGKIRYLPEGIRVVSLKFNDARLAGQKYLAFFPDGYIDEISLVIANRKNDSVTLVTSGRMGRVFLKEE